MAELHPQKIAVILDAQAWTYSELIEQIERVADYLHHLNIVKGQIIYQFVERSLEMVCGFLGIMCIDAVYCPLNPTDSPTRLISILEQIQSQYVLVHQMTYNQFPKDLVKHVILLEEILSPLSQIEDINALPYSVENGPAFIVCTSGTTGRPKAIIHTHKSFAASNAAYIQWNANMYTIQDQVLQLATCTWILQLSEITLPLIVGGSVILLRPNGHLDMSYLSKVMINQQVTTLIIGPAIIRALIDFFEISQQFDAFKFVHNICVTAEAVNPQQWIKFLSYLNLSTTRINSQYGMSECNGVLGCRLLDVYDTNIPIGRPFSNVRCLLIDEQDNIIDNTINSNKIGQLLIGGPTLFDCYLNDPRRTSDVLVTIDNHKYLKTGDLARYNERSELVHAGRADFQIKIHGQRVETTEIEDTIMNWSRNKISGCLVTKSPQNKDLLVAYIVSCDSELNIEEIRNHCSKHLRQYMIPSYIIVLDQFPLNSNGKIDRKQLPIPSSLMNVLIDDRPVTELEEKIHKLWCSVLQLNSIPRHANCFALGGSSLSLIQFFNYYQFHFAPDMQLNVLDFFINPTIADHVQLLLNCKPQPKMILSPLHLVQGVTSFAQKRLWMDEQVRFHESNNEQVSVFNELLIYKLTSITSLSMNRLRQALRLIVDKHAILRTALIFDQERLIQKILPLSPEHYEIQITYVTDDTNIKTILYDEETNRSLFNLEHGKVFRCHVLFQSSHIDLKHNDIIIFNFHHIAIDGNSMQVFINDLRQILSTGKLIWNEQECITYLDYAQYERLEDWSNARQYWNKVLTSTHQQSYSVRTGKGYTVTFDLDHTIVTSLNHFISQSNLTLFQVGLAAFFVFLYKMSNNQQLELCTGIVAVNRSQYQLENLIGCFVNTIPFFTKIIPHESFTQFCQRIQQIWLEILPYSNLPYQEMVKLNSNLRSSFLQTLFLIETRIDNNEQNIEIDQENALNIIERHLLTGNIAKFDMVCMLYENRRNETMSVILNLSLDLYDKSTISKISQHFHSILGELFNNQINKSINEYSFLLPDEKLLIKTMNNTQILSYSLTCIHHELSSQFVKYSQKISVELDDQSLTYAELSYYTQILSSNLLDNYHITPGDIVHQCVERSLSMIIGIVAIEMIGGIYCPLSSNDPQYRLNTLLKQTNSRIILTHWLTMPKFYDSNILLVDIDPILCSDNTGIISDINLTITCESIAYIIFTSGSTGIPKAVQIRQRNVIECIQSLCYIDLLNHRDTIIQMAQCSYDVHIQEILGTFMIGATLILLHPQGNLDIDYVLRILYEKQVSYLQSVPAYLNNIYEFVLKYNKSKIFTLRKLDIGGDISRMGLVKNLCHYLFDNPRVWNTYGPSETTIDCTFHLVDIINDKENIPIGVPLPNYRCMILDEFLQCCPIGQNGELFVSGVGVFTGYYQRDDLTKDVLIEIDNEIFYKTGDIVQMDNNGLLYYQNRKDYQVKLHGQRIELGEIEQCLLDTSISACVVMKWNDDHLVAFVESGDMTEKELYEHCRSHLPFHMIPSMFMILERLPRNENGKINRKCLPCPDRPVTDNLEIKRFNNEIESIVHKLWCNILQRNQIPIDSSIFTLGGHSLLLMKLYYRYQTIFQLEKNTLAITDLFEYSTIIDHAGLISKAIDTKKNIEECWCALHLTQARITFAQERIFLDEQIRFPSKHHNFIYVIPLIYRILSSTNPLSITRLHRALHTVVTKHQVLRSAFRFDTNGLIIQNCLDINAETYNFSVINVNGDAEIDKTIKAIINRSDLFDLSKGRVLHCQIIRCHNLGDLSHNEDTLITGDIIIFAFHHLVFDGTSVSIFLNDLSLAYTNDCSLPIDENVIQCIDSAVHERLMDMTRSHDFWYSQLKDFNFTRSLALPADRHCLSTDYRSGFHFVTQIYFDDDISTAFLDYVTLHRVTPFQLAMTIFYAFLFKLTNGQDDLCFSCLHSNRYRIELQNIIGMFVATLPFRIQLHSQWSFEKLVKNVHENCLSIFEHTHYPLQRILADFRLNYSNVSFLDILFEFLTVSPHIQKFFLNGSNLEQLSAEQLHDATLFDFNVMFVYNPAIENGKLLCNIYGSRDVFDETTINKVSRRLQAVFSQIFTTESGGDRSIDKLSLALPDEGDIVQMKLHEQRDVLSEIEQCLLNTSISACMVTKWNDDYLIAYVESGDMTEKELYEHCRSHLPFHMIPSMFMRLEKLPRNEDGTIDEDLLRKSYFSTVINADILSLMQLEEHLRQIFSHTLHYQWPDVIRSFSEMGVTSLDVLRILYIIQKDICPMVTGSFLFANPSIRQLARAIKPLLRIYDSQSRDSRMFSNEISLVPVESTTFVPLNVAIIGCGIGGLSAAIAIRRHGHQVTVYERAHFASEVGASISVAANGTKFLEEWGVDTVAGRSVILQQLIMRNWKDGTINDIYDLSDYKEKWGYVYNMFHRIDLHEQLQIKAKALGVKIIIDHKAIDVDCVNRTVTFDTGTTICVDLIIGADGVRSAVRSLIGIVAKTTPSTSACYRCIIPTSRVKQLGLKNFAPNNAIEFWGGFGINKIVLAPCCSGEIVSFYCFYPASHNDQSEEGWNFSATPSMLIGRFPDLDPDLLDIFEHCEDIKLWKLVIHQSYPYWVKDCVALLGDAAHPMLPDQSQGACMAIEDAAALGIIFSPKYWTKKIHTVEHGLKLYEMLRKPRATKVQEASARARENLSERIGWSSQRNHGNQKNTTTKLTIDEINTYDMEKHLDSLLISLK